MSEKICGIYMIKNIVNGKIYIGKAVDIYRRWKKHKTMLNNNKHYNKHLQSAWNKYGQENFKFSVIEICENDNFILSNQERYYIDKYRCKNPIFGYNKTDGGDGTAGYHYTEEQKQAARERVSGERNYQYGIPKSEDFKRNVSDKLKGRQSPMLGKHHSEDAKQKISNASREHAKRREIYCPELDEYFCGVTEAENKYGICHANIVACCKHRLLSAGKHPITGVKLTWVYTDEINNSCCA